VDLSLRAGDALGLAREPGCGEMALVMPAAWTYFLSIMCCYRLRGGEGTEVDGDEAVYGVGCGVRYVSSAGSGRLLLWVIEDPREIPRPVTRGECAATFDTLLYDLERDVFFVLRLEQAAGR
jgi:hypothetical protein